MKKTLLLLTCFMFSLISLRAQQLSHTYRFDAPTFAERQSNYVEAMMNNCLNLGREGQPSMPHYSAEILLPQGHRLTAVKVVSVTWSESIPDIDIVPASRSFPISQPAPDGYRPQPDKSVYGTSDAFPAVPVSTFSTQKLGGYTIGVVSLVPLQYMPGEHAVRYITEMTLSFDTEPERTKNTLRAKASAAATARVKALVDNPDAVVQYHFDNVKSGNETDLLLITRSDFADVIQPYADYKTRRGFITEVVTTDDIYTTYSGADQAEQIRNCIIDYYENHGLQYVILAGDADGNNPQDNIVPHRGFFIDNTHGTYDADLPSDMYYACLDGNWNNNGNDRYGEPGEEDLFGEVSIGRLAADSPQEFTNMISKLIKYQDTPVVADVEKALMVGEALDETTWGGDSKEEVAMGSTNYGYTTAGLSDNFSIERLYEKNDFWSKQDIIAAFNSGCHLINHLGHSNVSINMKLENGDLTLTNFTNDGVSRGLVIGYSQGCYNGAFDNRNSNFTYQTDCFTETITTLPTGMVASVGNTRYGWYQKNTTNGASQYFDRQFFDAIFGEDITTIGQANADSKEDNSAFILENAIIRWCAYELTVFGDPGMDIWTAAPAEMNVQLPMGIQIGSSELTLSTDAPFARVGMMQDGVLIGRGLCDQNGDATIAFFTPLSINEPIEITISGHNKLVFNETIPVLTDQAYVMISDLQINDQSGNNNGEADFGESLLLGLSLTNVGNQPAQNVTAALTSADPYITLPATIVDFGDFDAGETKTLSDIFEVVVSGDIPDQHKIDIDVHATGGEEWISDFDLLVRAPTLVFGGYTLTETGEGNGNDLPDPGEDLAVTMEISNTGHSQSPDISGLLASDNTAVTITDSSSEHTSLAAGQSGTLSFGIHIADNAVAGTLATLNLNTTAGMYLVQNTITLALGMPVEDFETADFSSFDWENTGDQPWVIDSDHAWHGSHSMRSGAIADNQQSVIKCTLFCAEPDTISFYLKTSSEAGYDVLDFYIDLVRAGQWSGETDWQKVSFSLYPGLHTFKWIYHKDEYNTGGEDCARIDFIEFPLIVESNLTTGGDATICAGDIFAIPAQGAFINTISWETSGDGSFSNAHILSPDYTPGPADEAAGTVELSVTAADISGQSIADAMTLTIATEPAEPAIPAGDAEVCTNRGWTYDYSIPPVEGATAYVWQLTPEAAGTLTVSDTTVTILWTPEYEGNLQLSAAAANDCGESNFSATLNIEAMLCSGIGETTAQTLQVQPNPGNGLFTITLPADEQQLTVAASNSSGQLVFQKELRQHDGTLVLDMRRYDPGMYMLRITSPARCYTQKIIIR